MNRARVVGLSVGTLGAALLAGSLGLQVHAAKAPQLPRGQPLQVSGPVFVAGVVEPGVDLNRPARCTVASAGGPAGPRVVQVAMRPEPYQSLRFGRRVDGPATLVCDRRVAFARGLLARTYLVGAVPQLQLCYVVVTMAGFAYARHRRSV